MHKIYIAAPWTRKSEASWAQRLCEQSGHTVTSRWITKHSDILNADDPKHFPELQQQATEDLVDLRDATVFIIMNLEKSEGKATELGYAVAYNKIIFLVGEPSINIFYHLPQVIKCASVEEVCEQLKVYDNIKRAGRL